MSSSTNYIKPDGKLYVAVDKSTGLFSRRVRKILMDNSEWIETQNPSIDSVSFEIAVSSSLDNPVWTENLQDAETWDNYLIDRYGKYVHNVEFKAVTLNID